MARNRIRRMDHLFIDFSPFLTRRRRKLFCCHETGVTRDSTHTEKKIIWRILLCVLERTTSPITHHQLFPTFSCSPVFSKSNKCQYKLSLYFSPCIFRFKSWFSNFRIPCIYIDIADYCIFQKDIQKATNSVY